MHDGCMRTIGIRIHLREGTEGETPVHISARERDVTILRAESQVWIRVDATVSSLVNRSRQMLADIVPDEGVDLLNCVLDFVVRVSWLDAQLKNESVNLVYNKGDFDTFLERVADDRLSVAHHLWSPFSQPNSSEY